MKSSVSGRVKSFDKSKGYGLVEVPGRVADFFLHINDVQRGSPTPVVRGLCSGLLLLVFIRIVYEAFNRSLPSSFDAWSVGDWLISYRVGFIRRGLLGSIILALSDLTSLRPEMIVFAIKLLCFSMIFLLAMRAVLKAPRLKVAHLLLLMSPAVLLFPFNQLQG